MEPRPRLSALPTLRTERLVLRAFEASDAPRIRRYAGEVEKDGGELGYWIGKP